MAGVATDARLSEVAGRLSELSRQQAYNVYELFDWPDSLPEDQYWIAPELMTVHGTPVWEELTEEERIRLSRWESVNFFSLNVHLIRELIGEVADRIYTTRFPGLSDFFHDFIHEENEHMWFFATFCRRYGGKLYPTRRLNTEFAGDDGALHDLTVFGRILIAEELCDAFNAPMGTDERLPRIVQDINQVHHRDESRHIAFNRQLMRALAEEAAATSGPDGPARAGDYLARYITVCLRSLYNPTVYLDAELPNARGLRARLLGDVARQEAHRALLSRTMSFLERIGLCTEADVAW
ncbi:diiron oxygenase [Streptomyces chartreusis]|uniref:diiron oxygenase n=1 Tax=Streptomyces chartreusis TaxID=1969 RepID=UPI0033A933FF